MIEVAALAIYPLKGGRGVPLGELAIDELGPRNDRRWMVVDSTGSLVTQREVARLCQVSARPIDGMLRLSAPDARPLEVPVPADRSPRRSVRVWRDRVDAIDAGDDPARWFSDCLGQPVRLVYLPETAGRRTDPAFDPIGSPVSFADGYPVLVIGEASLADLNQRLDQPLPMNRFRPNIVLRGAPAFAEDDWASLEIGPVRFDLVKPCARCMVTTTDQETGQRGREPLLTLARYRRRGSGLMFGMNAVHRATGVVRVGDPVTPRPRA